MENITWTLLYAEEVPTSGGGNELRTTSVMFLALWMVLPLFGVITNIINIKTFVSIGVDDGVSVSLLALSISDFGYSASSVLMSSSLLVTRLEFLHDVLFPIDPFAFTIFVSTVGFGMYSITGMTTTFLAVARCMCVAKPLHFKDTFTRSRSITTHVIFAVVAVCSYGAVLLQMGTTPAFDVNLNLTRRVLWFSEIREEVKDVVYFLYDTVVVLVTQVVMIVCVIIMAASLRKSLKFRNTSKTDESDEKKTSTNKLSGKELQVIKQVVLISIVYVLCSLSKTFTSIYGLVQPEFAIGGRLNSFYYDMNFTRNAFEIFNSGSTFFIYYNFNSKFRARLQNTAISKTS